MDNMITRPKKWLVCLLVFLSTFISSAQEMKSQELQDLIKEAEGLNLAERDSFLHFSLSDRIWKQETESWIHRSLFKTHFLLGFADSALYHAIRGYEIDVAINDLEAQASDISNILAYYLDTDQEEEGLKYALMLEKLMPEVKSNYLKFVYLQNIGAIFQQVGNTEKALQLYLQAVSVANENKIDSDLGWTYQNIASLYINELKDTATSRLWYNRAIQLADSTGNDEIAVYGYIGLASSKTSPDSLLTAIRLLLRADSLAVRLKMPRLEAEVAELLANFYNRMGRHKEAHDALRRFIDLKLALMRNEKSEVMAQMEKTFESELKDAELALIQEKAEYATQWKNIYLGFLILAVLVISIIVVQHRKLMRQRTLLEAQKVDRIMRQQEMNMLDAQIEAQESERQRISHDLHDRLGGLLSTLRLVFENIKMNLTSESLENVERFYKCSEMLDEAYQEVRQISHNLESGYIVQLGLKASLQKLVQDIQNSTGIVIETHIHHSELHLKQEIQIALYRIIQELITNTIKHAKASKISVSLTRHPETVNLIYEDNGTGLRRHEKIKKSYGLGLNSISARVKKLNGEIVTDSHENRGLMYIIDIPASQE